MKRSELKSIVKECVKEVLFEEGVLSNLVAEVAYGITKAQGLVVEQKPVVDKVTQEANAKEAEEARRKKLLETKRKMLDAMGNSKLQNVFEGTEPLRQGGAPDASPGTSPMSGRDPNDAGVDISGLFGLAGQKWNALK
tara:strand:+ start:22331 stop:22744 length:414 start_codon:yes stop_codon:yes gene_type:complete